MLRVFPRQSPSSAILFEMSSDAELAPARARLFHIIAFLGIWDKRQGIQTPAIPPEWLGEVKVHRCCRCRPTKTTLRGTSQAVKMT